MENATSLKMTWYKFEDIFKKLINYLKNLFLGKEILHLILHFFVGTNLENILQVEKLPILILLMNPMH